MTLSPDGVSAIDEALALADEQECSGSWVDGEWYGDNCERCREQKAIEAEHAESDVDL